MQSSLFIILNKIATNRYIHTTIMGYYMFNDINKKSYRYSELNNDSFYDKDKYVILFVTLCGSALSSNPEQVWPILLRDLHCVQNPERFQ